MSLKNPSIPTNAVAEIKSYLLQCQTNICLALEERDSHSRFIRDEWQRAEGGGGLSCVLENGAVFAKAGVNFSHVYGDTLPQSATAHRKELAGARFEALGLSLVIHPENPFVPTTHANIRFFQARTKEDEVVWWFGGGFDLTPYYGFTEDCIHWHQTAANACASFGSEIYPRFKKACDDYFYLKHRQEARGIGGLFFDDFNELGFAQSFNLLKSIGDHFLLAYLPIVDKRKSLTYNTQQKEFQLFRRGRYVEFNLIYDRGTLFGLQSGGRTESILMSLPPEVQWRYNWHPERGSAEEKLYTEFLPAKDWLG